MKHVLGSHETVHAALVELAGVVGARAVHPGEGLVRAGMTAQAGGGPGGMGAALAGVGAVMYRAGQRGWWQGVGGGPTCTGHHTCSCHEGSRGIWTWRAGWVVAGLVERQSETKELALDAQPAGLRGCWRVWRGHGACGNARHRCRSPLGSACTAGSRLLGCPEIGSCCRRTVSQGKSLRRQNKRVSQVVTRH